MQKNAPKILAVVLLVAIAALVLVAGGSDIVNFFDQIIMADAGEDDGDVIDNANNSQNNNNNNDNDNMNNNDDDKDDEDDEISAPSLQVDFPKAAKISSKYLYEQSLEVVGELELHKTFYTNKGVYMIISADSREGDLVTTKMTFSIIRMSFDGTLERLTMLETQGVARFAVSQITDCGIVVILSTEDTTYVYHIDDELAILDKIEVVSCNNAAIFSLSEGYILITQRAEGNTVYFIKDHDIVKSSLLSASTTVEIVETESALNLFVNGINGYSVVTMDKELLGYETISIPARSLLRIQPIVEDGKLYYLAAERENGNITLVKYTDTYRPTGVSISLGRADTVNTYLNGNSVLVILQKESTTVMYLCDLSLDIVAINASYLKDAERIYMTREYQDGYYILLSTDNKYMLVDVRNDGIIFTNTINEIPVEAEFLRRHDGEIILFYQTAKNSTKCINIIAIRY